MMAGELPPDFREINVLQVVSRNTSATHQAAPACLRFLEGADRPRIGASVAKYVIE
jgi:hypothetical protein